jgi:hypothetical protein
MGEIDSVRGIILLLTYPCRFTNSYDFFDLEAQIKCCHCCMERVISCDEFCVGKTLRDSEGRDHYR